MQENRLRQVPKENRLKQVPKENRLRQVPQENRIRQVPQENWFRQVPKENRFRQVQLYHFIRDKTLQGHNSSNLAWAPENFHTVARPAGYYLFSTIFIYAKSVDRP